MAEVRANPLIVNGLNVLVCGMLAYFSFLRGETYTGGIFVVLFLASVALSAYMVFKLYRRGNLRESVRKLQERLWYWGAAIFLGLMVFVLGITSNNIVSMVFGAFLFCGMTSSFLTNYVKSDHIAKRALEVILLFVALGVVVYGYVVTGSPVLGIILLFAVTLFVVAFVSSYILPKIRGELGTQPKTEAM